MRDAVGEVLAQRKALDRGAGAGIAISLLLHGAITAAAVFAALRHPSEESVRVIEIKLAKPAPAVAVPQEDRLKPVPTPHQAAPPAPAPIAKPAAKPVAASPFGKSPKKATEAPPVKPALPPTTINQQPTTNEIPIGGTGAVVEGDFPYTIYIDRMKTLIGNHWYRGEARPGTATTVKFTIERDGAIHDVSTETSSGNGTFDRAALRAVMEASPLPPLPFGYSGTYINIHLTFK